MTDETGSTPLNEPSDLGGGRGLSMYGGSEILTRDGARLWVQDSSAAMSPHVRVFYEPGPHSSPDPHLNLVEAIELRDRLTQFIDGTAQTWGEDCLKAAYLFVAERRMQGGEEIGKGEEAS